MNTKVVIIFQAWPVLSLFPSRFRCFYVCVKGCYVCVKGCHTACATQYDSPYDSRLLNLLNLLQSIMHAMLLCLHHACYFVHAKLPEMEFCQSWSAPLQEYPDRQIPFLEFFQLHYRNSARAVEAVLRAAVEGLEGRDPVKGFHHSCPAFYAQLVTPAGKPVTHTYKPPLHTSLLPCLVLETLSHTLMLDVWTLWPPTLCLNSPMLP